MPKDLASTLDIFQKVIIEAGRGQDNSALKLECLFELQFLIQRTPKQGIIPHQQRVEEILLTVIQQSPGAPIARLTSKNLCLLFAHGEFRNLISVSEKLFSWLSPKSPISSNPVTRCAVINCLGHLSHKHGPLMMSVVCKAADALLKLLRSSEASVKLASLDALTLMTKTCGTSPMFQAIHAEFIDAVSRLVDRSQAIRISSAKAVYALAETSQSLWVSPARELFDYCVRNFEGSLPNVRSCFVETMGKMANIAVIQAEKERQKKLREKKLTESSMDMTDAGNGGGNGNDVIGSSSQDDDSSQNSFESMKQRWVASLVRKAGPVSIDGFDGALKILGAPFLKTPAALGFRVSKELRVSAIAAHITFFKVLDAGLLESNIKVVCDHLINGLFKPAVLSSSRPIDIGQIQICIASAFTELCDCLAERGRQLLLKEMFTILQSYTSTIPTQQTTTPTNNISYSASSSNSTIDPNAVGSESLLINPLLVTALWVAGETISKLGAAAASDEKSQAFHPLLISYLQHPSPSVRQATARCLKCIGVAECHQLGALINTVLKLVMTDHADILSTRNPSQLLLDGLHGHVHALSALISAIPSCSLGCPGALPNAVLNAAVALLSAQGGVSSVLGGIQGEAAWLLVETLTVMDVDWLTTGGRLSKIFSMWKISLQRRANISADALQTAEREVKFELQQRSAALRALSAFAKTFPVGLTSHLVRPVAALVTPSLQLAANLSSAAQIPKSLESYQHALNASLFSVLAQLPPSSFQSKHGSVLNLLVGQIWNTTALESPSLILRGLAESENYVTGTSGNIVVTNEMSPEFDFVDMRMPADIDEALTWGIDRYPVTPFSPQFSGISKQHGYKGTKTCQFDALDGAIRLFGIMLPELSEEHRNQLLQHVTDTFTELQQAQKASNSSSASLSSLLQSYPFAPPSGPVSNVCACLMSTVTEAALLQARYKKQKDNGGENEPAPILIGGAQHVECVRQGLTFCLQEANFLIRRGSAQALALLARVAGDEFSSSFIRSLEPEVKNKGNEARSGAFMAMGYYHKYGDTEITTSHIPQSLNVLQLGLRDKALCVRSAALHALWVIFESNGTEALSPHIRQLLTIVCILYLTDQTAYLENTIVLPIARIWNTILNSQSNEIRAGSQAVRRCVAVALDILEWEIPPTVVCAEALACIQSAQTHISLSTVDEYKLLDVILGYLEHENLSLRQVATRSIKQYLELGGVLPDHRKIAQLLFSQMYKAHNNNYLFKDMQAIIISLIQSTASSDSSKWLELLRQVIVAGNSFASVRESQQQEGGLVSRAVDKSRIDVEKFDEQDKYRQDDDDEEEADDEYVDEEYDDEYDEEDPIPPSIDDDEGEFLYVFCK
eukprot:c19700_g1_i1.p1 GENE.c19700_g1_i1~~c19700_g1_i1.p1  ORF type:complete len:1364 (-),score=682.56 c19700_g1_i1:480-4571(-)